MLVKHNNDTKSPEVQFGIQVKAAREARGWSQQALARHVKEASGLDIHQSGIARLESGKRPVTLNEAVALAKLLLLDLSGYSDVWPLGAVDGTTEGLKSLSGRLMIVQAEIEEVASQAAELDEERLHLQEKLFKLKVTESLLRARIDNAQQHLNRAGADGDR